MIIKTNVIPGDIAFFKGTDGTIKSGIVDYNVYVERLHRKPIVRFSINGIKVNTNDCYQNELFVQSLDKEIDIPDYIPTNTKIQWMCDGKTCEVAMELIPLAYEGKEWDAVAEYVMYDYCWDDRPREGFPEITEIGKIRLSTEKATSDSSRPYEVYKTIDDDDYKINIPAHFANSKVIEIPDFGLHCGNVILGEKIVEVGYEFATERRPACLEINFVDAATEKHFSSMHISFYEMLYDTRVGYDHDEMTIMDLLPDIGRDEKDFFISEPN